MAEKTGLKHLFIVGCPRSGTTWTLMLLARHPRLVAAQHVGFLQSLRHLEDWWIEHELQKKRWGKSVVLVGEGAKESAGVKTDGLMTAEDFYALCRDATDRVFDGIVKKRPDAEVVLEKTPENVRFADFILKLYPDAYFLHVMRDPRAVYASLKSAVKSFEKTSVFPGNPMAGARFWRDDVTRGRAIRDLTPNYYEIRYEHMLERGPEELEKVLSWLGLDADRAFCEEAVRAASLENLQKIPNAPTAFFRRGEAESFKDELTEDEIRILEFVLKDMMDELGYPLMYPGQARKPLRLLADEGFRKAIERLEDVGLRTARKFGYVLPRGAGERRKRRGL
jgi:hypothetical protein